jgi:hypothetical protein
MDIKDRMDSETDKVHSWRKCGRGKHLVREHVVHVHPSKTHPNGEDATWHEHCATNPSKKDELSFVEIKYISETHFSNLLGPPTAEVLTKKFPDADKYDVEIRGWVQYWNEIFKLDDPLDPNVVKALIATESSFDSNSHKYKNVYGLMQITGETHQFLEGAKNELKNYLVCLPSEELFDPSSNICAGVRWLFRKKETAAHLLHRNATWEETVEDYKAILARRIKNKPYNSKPMDDFHEYYNILQAGKK